MRVKYVILITIIHPRITNVAITGNEALTISLIAFKTGRFIASFDAKLMTTTRRPTNDIEVSPYPHIVADAGPVEPSFDEPPLKKSLTNIPATESISIVVVSNGKLLFT